MDKPTNRQQTVMAITMAVLMLIIILILASCTTTRRVVESVTVHDTIVSVRTDTVMDVQSIQVHDTMMVKEYHTYTINNNGDTIRENHHLVEVQKTIVVDSTYRYQSERDSLRQALVEEKQKKKIITKEKVPLRWMFITAAAVLLAFWIVIVEIRKKKASSRD